MALAKTLAPTFSGHALQAWRERMGFTQRDASKTLGCSADAWNRWETGKAKPPRYIGLACAALALGMKAYGETQGDDK